LFHFFITIIVLETLQSALLRENSYAKFLLDNSAQNNKNLSSTIESLGSELDVIRLSFTPFDIDGMLFQFNAHPSWLACGLEKGQIVVFFGKVNMVKSKTNSVT